MPSKSISTRSKKNLQQASLLARQMKDAFNRGNFIEGMVLADKFLDTLGKEIPPEFRETIVELEGNLTKSHRVSKVYRA